MSDDEIMAAMRPHLDEGDGGYICDMARKRVIAAGRAIEQASRRAALEEAAQRVMKIVGYPPREYYAEAILALTDGDKQ